ncbi:MAG: hypothetical protein M1514_04155 [Patescibacteria group bacterium]|nr:hypothetical protein [Patescibacteria group bacterium]
MRERWAERPEVDLVVAEESLVSCGLGYLRVLLDNGTQAKFLSDLVSGDEEKIRFWEELLQSEFPKVPPKGIYGQLSPSTPNVGLTDFGRHLQAFQEENPDAYLVIIRDVAREIFGEKPFDKSRPVWQRAYNANLPAEFLSSFPEIDGYFVFGREFPSLAEIARGFAHGSYHPSERGIVSVRTSKRRPDHHYLLIGKSKLTEPFAHLCFPKNFNLLFSLMAEENCPGVLVVPTRNEAGQITGFEGRLLHFFPTPRQVLLNFLGHDLRPGIYYCPDVVLPLAGNWPETLDGVMRMLKTSAWNDLLPILNRRNFADRLLGPKDCLDQRRFLSLYRQTCAWIEENVVHVLASQPELLGEEKQRRANARFLVEKFFDSLDGDYGLSYQKAKDMGFFRPQGFWPEMGEFLAAEDRESRLLTKMADESIEKKESGSRVFLDFLFAETGNEVSVVTWLLRPKIYPDHNLSEFAQTCLKKDKDLFGEMWTKEYEDLTEPIYWQETEARLLQILEEGSRPLGFSKIVEKLGCSTYQAKRILRRLQEKDRVACVTECPEVLVLN